MTTAADDRANEDAFEALLAGRPAPEAAAGLAAFTGAVRGAAAAPGRPSAALADLLSTGLLTDQSSPSARTAPTAGATRSHRRTRRRTPVISVLVAKFLSAGAVAQAAAGAGVVVVLTAGAGTAGVLPGDLQTAYSSLTGSEQTLDDPEGTDGSVPGEGEPADTTVPPQEDVIEPSEPVEPLQPAGPTDEEMAEAWAAEGELVRSQADFKAWLARGKEQGWVTGEAVSAAAHARNEARKAARDGVEDDAGETPVAEVPVSGTTGEVADEPETEVESDDDTSGDGDTSGAGKGKGGGKGKGRG